MKCLIIDDDPLIGDLISHFCSKIDQIEYCVTAYTGTDGLKLLTSDAFDLLFLDFDLPDMKGQTILELKQNGIPVIMVTSHDEFAAKSYEYDNVVDFLVKPVSFARFEKAIQKLSQRSDIVPNKGNDPRDFLFVKSGNKWIKVNKADLLYIKAEENYVSFVTKDKSVLSLITMKEIELKLPSNFMRIHRSFIVNVSKIESLVQDEVLINGKQLPVGMKYKKDLLAVINQ